MRAYKLYYPFSQWSASKFFITFIKSVSTYNLSKHLTQKRFVISLHFTFLFEILDALVTITLFPSPNLLWSQFTNFLLFIYLMTLLTPLDETSLIYLSISTTYPYLVVYSYKSHFSSNLKLLKHHKLLLNTFFIFL